jgi:hypothetical protein
VAAEQGSQPLEERDVKYCLLERREDILKVRGHIFSLINVGSGFDCPYSFPFLIKNYFLIRM